MAHDLAVLNPIDKIYQNRRGLLGFNKFGRNPSVSTGAAQEVWVGPTPTYNFLASASTLYVSSSAAGDTEQLLVQGLNADWELQQTLVTLAGNAFVEVPATTWIRIYRMSNVNGNDLVGNIYLSSDNAGTAGVPTDTSKVHGFIVAGQQITQQTPFSIPDGFEGLAMDVSQSLGISGGGTRVIDLVIMNRPFGLQFREAFRTNLSSTGTTAYSPIIAYPIAIPPKTDISVTATSSLSGADIAISYTVALLPATLIPTQSNVALTQGAATEVLAARSYRESFSMQLQGPGYAWVKFGATAGKNDGIRIGPWRVLRGSQDFGEAFNAWNGSVSVFYEGGAFGKQGGGGGEPVSAANIYVTETVMP